LKQVADVHYLERGSGPTVIFLHGIGADAESFTFQLEAFATAGYHAVSWDMPGYGRSLPLTPMTFPGLAQRLQQLLEELNVSAVHVVGHSIGGMIAQQLARTAQEKLLTMVLAQTSPAFGSKDGEFQRQFVADRLQPLQQGQSMADIATEVLPSLVGVGPDKRGVELAHKCMSRVPSDAYVAAVQCLVEFEGRDHLPLIAVPTLVLAGEKDDNAPASMMEKMAKKIPGAEFATMPNAGHLAPMGNPDEFNNAVLDFLARHAYKRNINQASTVK
jgi:pimeloyl-ACP methyl ester carboxylesterase